PRRAAAGPAGQKWWPGCSSGLLEYGRPAAAWFWLWGPAEVDASAASRSALNALAHGAEPAHGPAGSGGQGAAGGDEATLPGTAVTRSAAVWKRPRPQDGRSCGRVSGHGRDAGAGAGAGDIAAMAAPAKAWTRQRRTPVPAA